MTLEQALAILTPAMPFLLALAAALYQGLLQRLPAAQHTQLANIASTVVSGVEQASSVGAMSSADKKTAAVTAVTSIAKAAGLGKFASPTLVNMLIEAAVYEMNQYSTSASSSVLGVAPSAVGAGTSMPAL